MIGQTISHYKILEKLGEGGMGVVYKAEDTKLKRVVALKFLPPEFTRDQTTKERFIQEAQAASALDHSNVCTIYEINETDDGHMYMAMACYTGETLEQRIARGPLAIDEALDIARQIAEGLSKAHNKGIVHRDIKPANVFLTEDGGVKIVDFGLAKLAGQVGITKAGITVGTVAYMSPEQARGEEVDGRTDVWSLGVVLYEMIAGRRPFKGAHEQAVIYSIVNDEPEPIDRLRPNVPAPVRHVVAMALQKDRENRLGDISTFVKELRSATERPRAIEGRREVRSRWQMLLPYAVVAAAFVLILFSLDRLLISRERPHRPPVYKQVTFLGDVHFPVLSSDARHLAYLAPEESGSYGLWVKDLDTGSAIKIFSAPRCWLVGWSPNGSHLLFGAIHSETDMGTYVIARLGGEPRRVFNDPWLWSAWSPDGTRVAKLGVGLSQLSIVDLETGGTRVIPLRVDTEESSEIAHLDWSPTRDLLLFQVDDTKQQSFWTIRPDGSEQTLLMALDYDPKALIANPRWSPGGDAVYYFRFSLKGQGAMDLMKIAIDPDTRRGTGDPVTVLSGLHTGEEDFSISGDGSQFLYVQETRYSNLWMATVEGEEGTFSAKKIRLTTGETWKSRAEISPDEGYIAFSMSSGDASNIYTMTLPRTADVSNGIESPRQLTFFNSLNDMPVWSPDGSEIAFYSAQGGAPRVWHMSSDGGTPEPFEGAEFESYVADRLAWAPGNRIIHRSVGIRNFRLFDPATGSSRPLVEADSLGYAFSPCWSPDGKRVAFFWNRERENPPMGAWVKDVTDGSVWRIAETIVNPVGWTPDGEWIWGLRYDVTEGGLNELFKIPARGGESVPWVELPFDEIDSDRISMTPDGRTFVYSKAERHADAWIIENFDPDVE